MVYVYLNMFDLLNKEDLKDQLQMILFNNIKKIKNLVRTIIVKT